MTYIHARIRAQLFKKLHKRHTKSTIKFCDVQVCCNKQLKNRTFFKNEQLEDKFIVVSIELHNK